jgi:ferredoxin-type protein NapH
MEPSNIPQPGEEAGTLKPATAKRRRFRAPMWAFRTTSVLLIAGLLVYGSMCKSGYGSLCALGSGVFGVTCPLGFLGAAFASRSLLSGLWLSVGLAIVPIILLGRFFCAWVCPASLVPSLKGKVRLKIFRSRWPIAKDIKSKRGENGTAYSGLAVLAGALVSSYLFGFPVFCLICPVGLTLGTVFAAVRWFSGGPPGLELAIFPLMIAAELFLLKSWCRSLCPLGAVLGLISRMNLLLRPKMQKDECLATRGLNCRICERACPQAMTREEITCGSGSTRCTKCFECYEKCPVGAIHIKTFRG